MKFALFATGAFAATLVQRDAAAIESDVAAIQSATNNLDTAIKAITGPSSKNAVLSANQAVLSAINKGITDAKASQPLTQTEALEIASPIGNLASAVSQSVSDLIAKKQIIVSSGFGSLTEQQLTEVQSASEAFSSDVTALVPSSLQGTASQLSGQILDALASGVAAFKNTGGSTSGSSSSSAAAASSTMASSSSMAAASSSVSSAVSSASSAVSSAVSSASMPATSSYPTGSTGSSNSTSSSTPSSTPYTGAASSTVAGFGGLVAAAVALVAAL